ncbi:MAG: glycosyl hydrolase family 28-related protein [Trichloromonas sp.]|nr:glycosyl hydrolase family 28-related protein [Trichloromonas sp.]
MILILHINFISPATYYIRSTTGSDSGNSGTSPEDAFQTLTKVFSGNPVLNDGDTIDIFGTFVFPSSQLLTKSVFIQGTDRWQSIIKGTAGSKARCFTIGDASNAPSVIVENVTFRDFDNWDDNNSLQGGAIQISYGSSFTCRKVNFINNQSYYGGAVNLVSGFAAFEDCLFRENKVKIRTDATNASGGAINVSVSNSNSSVFLIIDRCLLENNTTDNIASAIRFSRTSTNGNSILLIQNSTFIGNVISPLSNSTLAGTIYLDVKSTGVDDIKLINNTIAYNTSAVNSSIARVGLSILGIDNKVKLINNILFSNINEANYNLSISSSNKMKESRNNITDQSYNFDVNTITGFSSDNLNNITNAELQLDTLLVHHGGSTNTLALGVESVARDAGYPVDAPSIDQRRVSRVEIADVGAYEIIPWRSSLYPENWVPGYMDAQGRYLHDFSYAGYKSGEEDLPSVTNNIVNVTSPPYNVDNTGQTDVTSVLQQALNDVGTSGGGVVYLPQGTYKVSVGSSVTSALRIMYDNVILRGDGANKTYIYNSTTNFRTKQVIYITGPGASPWDTPVGGTIALSSDVSSSSFTIGLESVSGLRVGDLIMVATDCTTAFLQEIQAHEFWPTSMEGQRYCRTITDIDPVTKIVTVDIPIRYPIKIRDNGRIYKLKHHLEGCGIELLSVGNQQNPKIVGVSDKDLEYLNSGTGEYEVHLTSLITLRNVKDCWVKNVSSYRPSSNTYDIHSLSNGVQLLECKNVTLMNCNFSKPQYRGASNGYTYVVQSNDCLILNCRSERARHSFSYTAGMKTNGNAISKCTGVDPRLPFDFHRHFCLVNLIDQYTSQGDYINADFSEGGTITGDMHGYTTTESVIWNTKSTKAHSVNFLIRSRQHGNGYVIGTSGVVNNVVTTPVSGTVAGTTYAYDTSPADFVEGIGTGYLLIPQSLYADQLIKRKSQPNYIRTCNQTLDVKPELNNDVKIIQLSRNNIELQFSNNQYNEYSVYSIHGFEMFSGRIEPVSSKICILIQSLEAGIYIIKLKGINEPTKSFKILRSI